MSMVVVHVATGTRNILVFLGRMAEAMGHALQGPGPAESAPLAVGQPLSPARAAELSEDGEIFDSDDDGGLPTLRQILGSPKQVRSHL